MRRVTRKAPMLLLRLLCISAIIRQPRALLTVSSRPAQIPMHTRHRPTFITLVKPPLSHNALILQPQKAAHHLSSCIILSILPLCLPLEHNVPLPLDHSLETVDSLPYLQFLASKTSPPEKPLPPHPEPVTSILIHQRLIPPRTMNDSEIVKTDSTQPAAFACLSMDSDFSAGMLDLGIKSCNPCGLISSMSSKADEPRSSGITTYYMFCTGSKPLAQ